jgi:microcystin-dependent protein
MADPFLAQITQFGSNFAPRAWAFCDGQLLAISSNSALFSLLGTTFGGDGRTTFGLPELRGRTMVHPGHGPGLSSYRWGQRGGVETVTLNISEIPSHSHSASLSATGVVAVAGTAGTVSDDPTGRYWGKSPAAGPGQGDVYTDTKSTTMAADAIQIAGGGVTVGNTGGNLAHLNIQPFIGIYHIIAMQGIFPSRS